ncbi:hypothetical protein [Breznakia pachnodae]|uniref:Uncharacterized protein n=1 Tax=Breznakia pachnodae TaxID=265178 RepID=A0ABU0E6K1_9FIRM|nr:hypothetical protein [Breznakia pachnodae]MDQ0362532.1 hypothetical protein [Breznakia pachnodae]
MSSELITALVSAGVGALLTLIITLFLNKRDKQLEMRWIIYNDLIKDIYDAKKIAGKYIKELGNIWTYYEGIDDTGDKVNCVADFSYLLELSNEFFQIRNHFLMYSKMYQGKAKNKLSQLHSKMFHKENKITIFTNYLIECNTVFHDDGLYIRKAHDDLHGFFIKLRESGTTHPGGIKKGVSRIISKFKAKDIKVIELSELPILEYMYGTFKGVI